MELLFFYYECLYLDATVLEVLQDLSAKGWEGVDIGNDEGSFAREKALEYFRSLFRNSVSHQKLFGVRCYGQSKSYSFFSCHFILGASPFLKSNNFYIFVNLICAVMEKSAGIPTIYDVAREAGVARATVDRVIYNRGGVSDKTVLKVRETIEKLGYTTNPIASRLASKKRLTISCLIPHFEPGEYWAVAYHGFVEGVRSAKNYDITLDMHLFDPDDIASFEEESRKILEAAPAGVITNVVFADAVKSFAASLDEAGIPYAFVDQKIDGLNYRVYYGADPREAGALGAYLLTHRMDVKELAMIRLIRDPRQMADPNRVRREGFLDYVAEHFPACKVHTVFIHPDDPVETRGILKSFFDAHPGVKHITMANSRIHLLAPYLREFPDPERHVVGFDDLQKNLESLREGLVEYLVTRNIPMQSYYTISRLAESIVGNGQVKKDNYMHMDILHRLNCNDYEFKV